MAFQSLKEKNEQFAGLETFAAPASVYEVTMTSDEVTAVCPVTGQPDWYTIEIWYLPAALCLESKSLKLYLQSFRNEGVFCEALAHTVCADLYDKLQPDMLSVTVTQKSRGGISIVAKASLP